MNTIFQDVLTICRNNPQIVIFLALAIGYFIGKIKIFGFNLGSTAGVLLAALVLGQMEVSIPPLLKTVSFAFFIFAIGYKVGPQFFGGLKKEGLNYIWMSLVVAVVGLITAITLGKLMHFDPGTTAGMLSGAMTQSSAIGTAEGAISHLSISAAQKASWHTNVAVAYAITYIFGTAGMVIFCKVMPRLMKINLKEEARKLEEEMSGGHRDEVEESPELFSWRKRMLLRAYKVTGKDVIGKTVAEIEKMMPGKIVAEKVKQGGQTLEPAPDMVIKAGDEIALAGRREGFLNADQIIGPEIDDKDVIDIVGEVLDVCILNKEVAGKTLDVLSEKYGQRCFLRKITRMGQDIPITRKTVIDKCDVLQIVGAKDDVEEVAKYAGYIERPAPTTDLVMVGIACVLGTLLGLVVIPAFGVPITLGVGGGVLISGLVFGWLRSVHPTFGRVPDEAQWIFTDLGLNLFIACVGLVAGPQAVHAIQTTGLTLFFAGATLTLLPAMAGLLFGKYVIKLNPVLLFGAITGSGTVTAALNAVKEEADSSLPAIGYTVCYAFGNVILTIWGTVLINVMA
ncbi:MAG: aspartate-alanine antiporter [Candidatus Omnitrophica bacterium]|nr:aspartate-alanine antiporter [Candidatus Omnitrophota bacterium]